MRSTLVKRSILNTDKPYWFDFLGLTGVNTVVELVTMPFNIPSKLNSMNSNLLSGDDYQ